MIMWQDILKGAVANVLIDWTEMGYVNNIRVYEAEGSEKTFENINTTENPIVDKIEVKYSIGIYRENDGIKIKFHSGKARITIEGQVLEKDFEKFNHTATRVDFNLDGVLFIKPSFLAATVIKQLNEDGKLYFDEVWLGLE
tara:strand:+ start:187 stop:609 length:423 start_codon:yes stop_codon:yes gene_type:complete